MDISNFKINVKKSEEEKQRVVKQYELRRRYELLKETNEKLRAKYKAIAGKDFEE